ncbi:MAG: hypothetical protein VX589_08720, partial [Myxococcota bacterium]|nr:hypothetical protein [Myxococcota bacterium]
MTYHDTSIELVAVWGALVLLSLGIWFFAWRRRWTQIPGMRFPIGHRMKAVKRGLRARMTHSPLALRFFSLGLILFAIARPQLTENETAEVEGIDIVVAFD